MGVNIRVGGVVDTPPGEVDEDYPDECYVEPIVLKENKELPIPAGIKNTWSASYKGFRDLMSESGLGEVFYDKDDNFVGGHPGGFFITKEIVDKVETALINAKRKYLDYKMSMDVTDDQIVFLMDFLHWLSYWVNITFYYTDKPYIKNF